MKRFLAPPLLALVPVSAATAQAQEATTTTPLLVATYECPSFVIREADGTWSGLSILLWEAVAERLDRPFEYAELPLEELLAAAAVLHKSCEGFTA